MPKQQVIKNEACHRRDPEDRPSHIGQSGEERRRFIKTAIVTAPVILTVAGRPVWAGNCSYSGQLSGNLSDSDEPCGGEGCSRAFYLENIGLWHHDFLPETSFDCAFEVDAFSGATLLEVIRGRNLEVNLPGCALSFGPRQARLYKQEVRDLGMEAVAALQNAALTVSFDLPVCEVVRLFLTAYESCNERLVARVKNHFKSLNSQHCPF